MSSLTEDSNSPPPSKLTRTSGGQRSKTTKRAVHVVLQGKGGVGKTWVASLVAQYLREHDRPPVCFDTDPVNNSFAAIGALEAHPVSLVVDDAIDVEVVDGMIERIVQEDTDFVMDNGAASFIPLSNYLIGDSVADVIAEAGKDLVIHVILVGGGSATETAAGLTAVLSQFPPSVRIVVWVNEFFGPVAINGTKFEDTAFYSKNRDRLAGVVHLRRQNSHTTGVNLSAMLDKKLTFVEMLADPTTHVMPKQRLTQYRRAIWEQLDAVI